MSAFPPRTLEHPEGSGRFYGLIDGERPPLCEWDGLLFVNSRGGASRITPSGLKDPWCVGFWVRLLNHGGAKLYRPLPPSPSPSTEPPAFVPFDRASFPETFDPGEGVEYARMRDPYTFSNRFSDRLKFILTPQGHVHWAHEGSGEDGDEPLSHEFMDGLVAAGAACYELPKVQARKVEREPLPFMSRDTLRDAIRPYLDYKGFVDGPEFGTMAYGVLREIHKMVATEVLDQ